MKKIILCLLLLAFQPSFGQKFEWINNGFDIKEGSVSNIVYKEGKLIAESIGFLYESSDMGKSWKQKALPEFDINMLKLVNGKIFAGTNGDGLYYSTDNGVSWESTTLEAYYINFLTFDNNTIYAGTGRGVYISVDYGANWKRIGLPDTSVSSVIVSNKNIYAIAPKIGTFLTKDNGNSWSLTKLKWSPGTVAAMGNYIFSSNGEEKKGLILSTDNGESWSENKLFNESISTIYIAGTRIFVGTDNRGIIMSADSGKTWIKTNIPEVEFDHFESFGNNIFACTNNGLYISTDNGGSWELAGIPNQTVNSFVFKSNEVFVWTESNQLYSSPVDEILWKKVAEPIDFHIYVLKLSGNTLFAGSYNGVWRSDDEGISWKLSGLKDKEVYELTVSGGNVFAGTKYDGVFVSTDNGAGWNKTAMDNYYVTMLESNAGKVFASVIDFTNDMQFLTSTDNGNSWIMNELSELYVYSISISGSNVFANTWNRIYLSSDNGIKWESIGKFEPRISSMAVSGNNIFANSDYDGLLMSTDLGKSWNKAGTDYIFEYISSLAINGDYLYIGTRYGAYRARISDLTSVPEEIQPGSHAAIFPNPAGDFISLKIPDSPILAGNQIIEIISPLGVKVLETAYSDRIDISSLTRGAYYLKVGGKAYMFVKK